MGKIKTKNHLKDLGLAGRIILKVLFKKEDEALNWIVLFQDEDKEYDLVNMVIDGRVQNISSSLDYVRNV